MIIILRYIDEAGVDVVTASLSGGELDAVKIIWGREAGECD